MGDFFGGIGDILGGDVGGGLQRTGLTGTEQENRVIADPTTRALNELRLGDYYSAVKYFDNSGLAGAINNIQPYRELSPDTQALISMFRDRSDDIGLTPENWYQTSLQSLNPDFYLNNARDYLTRVLNPEISNQYSLLGLGRSGAVPEAQAKAAAGLSLPISQQYLQNIYGLNQQYPGIDTGLRAAGLERLGRGISFSDYPRQSALDVGSRQLQSYLSAATGTPYTPEVRTTGTGNEGILTSYLKGGGGSSGTAGLVALSDKRLKEIKAVFNSKDFLDTLKAYEFTYKGDDKLTAGILAQDLEKTEIGKNLVVNLKVLEGKEEYKAIDIPKAVSVLLATVVSLNERIKGLEEALVGSEV